MADSLSTTVLSGIISAVVSYFVSVFLKEREYKNDYFKKVIDKRLTTYQYVENVIAEFKYNKTRGDDRLFHIVFSDPPTFTNFYEQSVRVAIKNKIWLSADTATYLNALNDILLSSLTEHNIVRTSESLTEGGRKNYELINMVIEKLENSLRHDLYHMHDVKRFFKARN